MKVFILLTDDASIVGVFSSLESLCKKMDFPYPSFSSTEEIIQNIENNVPFTIVEKIVQ